MWQNSALTTTLLDQRALKSVCQCLVDSSVPVMTPQAPCCPMTSRAVPHLTYIVSIQQSCWYVTFLRSSPFYPTPKSHALPGAQPRFQSWGVKCLGVGYCTEQNADGIPSFVHCRLLRNGNHTLHQKSWGGPSKFWGSGPPRPPSGCALVLYNAFQSARHPKVPQKCFMSFKISNKEPDGYWHAAKTHIKYT